MKFSYFLKKEYLILLLVILIGSFLRLPGIFTNSFAFTYDAGRDMLALWNMVYAHKFSLIGPTTGLPGVFYGPWWYLILLPFYLIFGGNPQGLTLTIALFGVLTIFFGLLFAKKIGGVLLGLSFASMIAVSSSMTSLSSQIWSPNIAPIFVIFALFSLSRIYSEKKPRAVHFFILGFLLSIVSELGIVFGFLLIIGISLSLIIICYKNLSLKTIAAYILGILIVFSPRILFELRHQFLMTTSFIKFLTTGSSSQNFNLLGSFLDRVSLLFGQFNSTLALDNKLLGVIIILLITISMLLLYKKASEAYKNFIKTSCIVILTFLIALTFFSHDVWYHYLVGLPIFYMLLLSISVSLIAQKMKNFVILPVLIIIFLFLVNLNPISIINNLGKPMWVGDASVYRNQLQAVDYAYKEANGKSFKYVVYTPPVHDYTYQYLFKWYGPNKYHYAPNGNARLAYFILEPDLQYAFRLTDWLKVREKDGKIIKTERFKSGIIVQARIH